MANIRWTPEAERDRQDIWNYIASDNPSAAVLMDILFSQSIAKLERLPHLGRPGHVAATRELIPHPSYRLVYEISQQTIWILAIVHTARLWPAADD